MNYDHEYSVTKHYFGSEPEAILVDHWRILKGSLPVLDIGCGQGRNSLFLARQGVRVHALDPSEVAISQVSSVVAGEGLAVRTIHGGFAELDAGEGAYGGVLLFGIIQEADRATIAALCRSITRWVAPGGVLWVTAFTVEDPAFTVQAKSWEEVGPRSFRSPDGEVRTYLERGELSGLFGGFEAIHLWEGLGPEHRHGDGPPERHGKVEAVMRRGLRNFEF